jgi:pimeloyl-ACP methyl ester carboxylesterase
MILAVRRLLAVGLILSAAWTNACPGRADDGFTPVKSSVRYRKVGVYDKARLAAIVETDLDAFLAGSTMKRGEFKGSFPQPRHAVTLYEVQFDSVIPEWGNEPTVSGGLLAIPDDGGRSHPLLSYQHGTVFGLEEVPSRPDNSFETRLVLAAFASQGYVVIGADYFGLGTSRVGQGGRRAPNSFIVPEGTVQAMLDHFRASGEVLAALGQKTPQTFLYGWSQGGWSTMQFLRRLEALEIPVTAAATVSAPVDTAAAFRRPLANPRQQDAAWIKGCINNMIWAYEEYGRMPGFAASAIRPEHLAASRKFYDGELDWRAFNAGLPATAPEMLRPEFVATAATGRGRFWETLELTGAYRWRIQTPLRAYAGGADEAIPAEVSRMVVEFDRLLGGGTVEFFSAGERADHRASFVQATLALKPWLDALVTPPAR